jgi:hypothetical protein
VNSHRTALSVTISTHRLWKSLWTALGRTEDNAAKAVGPGWGIRPGSPVIPRASTATGPARTASVDAHYRAELGECTLSPASTDPIATTYLYLEEKSTTQQAGPDRSRGQACRRASRPTRGSDTHEAGSFKPLLAPERTFSGTEGSVL